MPAWVAPAEKLGRNFFWYKRAVRRALLPLLALMLLPGLGSPEGGTHPDEALYLTIGAEMAARGAWLDATIDGTESFHKPPLLYWAQRLCFLALGETLFAGRLPAALAAIALALLTGALAGRVKGRSLDRAEPVHPEPVEGAAALTAALLTATFLGTVRFGRIAMMDAPLALAVATAAYGAWLASEERRPRALLLCGLGAGAAMLLKGPVGVLLVLLVAGGFLAFRARGLLVSRWTAAAVGLGAALSLPWFVLSIARHGQAFVGAFLFREHGDKFLGDWQLSGELMLLGGLLVLTLPWTVWVLASLPGPRRLAEPGTLLALLWIASVLFVYSLPTVKHPHYLLPALPAAALLASRAPPPRWAAWTTAGLLGLVAAAGLLALRLPVSLSARLWLLVAALLLGAGAVLLLRARHPWAIAATGLGVSALIGLALPLASPRLLPPDAAELTRSRPLFLYGLHAGVHRFSAGKPVQRAWDEGHLREALDEGALAILSARELDALSPDLKARLAPVARWERLRRALPPREVWSAWRDASLAPLLEESLLVEAARP